MDRILLDCPTANFLILLAISEIMRRLFIKKPQISSSAGSIIMAIGIFSLFALTRLPFSTVSMERFVALELLIIGMYLVGSGIKKYRMGILMLSPEDQFGIGTWVAGSSILAILFSNMLPTWKVVIWILALLAFFIWLIYLGWLCINLSKMLAKRIKNQTGIILLSTVSTQSIVILLNTIFKNLVPIVINQTIILIGVLFYSVGIFIIVRSFIQTRIKNLIINWSNTNSIIHGALSITGLASIVTHSVNNKLIIATWIVASWLFVLVEAISVIRIFYRIKTLGWIKGVFVYDITQWARIFTYGMYYAFTISVFREVLFKNEIMNIVVLYGQYIVLSILLIEIILFLQSAIRCFNFPKE
jgi:hypothetical protein